MASRHNTSSPSNTGHLSSIPLQSASGNASNKHSVSATPGLSDTDSMLRKGVGINANANANCATGASALPVHNYGGVYDTNLHPKTTAGPTSHPITQHGASASSGHEGQASRSSEQDPLNLNTKRHGSIGDNSVTASEGFNDDPVTTTGSDALSSPANAESSAQADDATAPPPSWSELKTKAGKERKRLPLACIACRRKKIRCSGETPACKHCVRSRIPCVYKVTTRKAAPRTDYMAMLDKRLKRMEDRVIRIIPKEEQGILATTGRANVKPSIPPPPTPTKPGAVKKRPAEPEPEETSHSSKNRHILPLDDSSELALETVRDHLKAQEGEEHNLLREGADKLPPKDVQEHLAEVYFDYVHGQSYYLLHKPSFMRKLSQGQVAPVLLLAVCAMAARFSNHPSLRSDEPVFLRGESWAIAARDISLKRYDTPNITILIVYLILTLHEFGTCQGGRSWMFGGMAQRMAYALQLHQDLDHDPRRQNTQEKAELSLTDREIRRRAMWSCFLMDRFCSSGTDRPTFVGVEHIRAQLPVKEKYFIMEIGGPTEDLQGNVPNPVSSESGQLADAKRNMGVAAFTIRLVTTWGELISYYNLGGQQKETHAMWEEQSTFQTLKRAVSAWHESLPTTLHYIPENLANHVTEKIANHFIFMHIIYQQTILFMNRFALPYLEDSKTLPEDMPADFLRESAKAGLNAANAISALVHEGMDHAVVAPFAGYSAFFASTVHVQCAFSKDAALEASSKQNLAWNVNYLTKMKKYWGMFHFMTENLRDLYRKHADAARSSALQNGHTPKGGDGIFQYGDWFDRYPHGVSGTDHEEPQANVKTEPGADAVLGQQSDLQTVEEFFAKLPPAPRAVKSQPQKARKTMPKKQHSRSEAKIAPSTSLQQKQASDALQNQSMDRAPLQMSPGDTIGRQMQESNLAFPQHPSTFPPGYEQPTNAPLTAQQHPAVFSYLDRQMVLSSYAGLDANANLMAQGNMNLPSMDMNTSAMNYDFDFGSMPAGLPPGQASWGDPSSSSAWFMPFNLDPPNTADESGGIFSTNGGGFDFSGADGMINFSTTGLTPRPLQMEMNSGAEGQDASGVVDMHGLGPYQ